ncbi:phytoene/squalene synthase family protein [Lichenibacterium minor]|uniref:Phytoene/squalene synthase family protein n=1 Tax=Lichenibacterium minor TaxID=2316528 RepID=A0A4Q2UDD0_9HYPH|nr:squalene/phytoene synthase family protein [Lichenibacterium minor]RYC33096.1 phytoene/squalene synthase family protein [Lichenibacterium minor]
MTDLAAAYAHCEALLRAEDPDAWLAALLAPADARPHLHALGAVAVEVALVRTRVKQAIAGEIRLQWWQDVVDGGRATEAAAHPVAAALVDTIDRAALPRAPFGDMLDAFRMDLYDEPPADLPALERRLAATRAVPIGFAARVLGGGAAIDPAAEHAGVAIGLADLLDALRAGHDPLLPVALLARHGATRAEVAAGRDTPGLRAVAADLRSAARTRLAALRAKRGALGDAGPAFLRTALVEPRLKRGDRAAPFEPLPELPQWRRQWRLWRAARNGGVL